MSTVGALLETTLVACIKATSSSYDHISETPFKLVMKDMKSSRKRTTLARTTWTNSGEGKPDLVVHQDQQCKITLRILKARLFAQLSRFTNLFANILKQTKQSKQN